MKYLKQLEAAIDKVVRPVLLAIDAKHVMYFCVVACCIALLGLL